MHPGLKEIALALFATTAVIGAANAQSSYPCVNDAPNPYKLVSGWTQMPRSWAPTNNVYVDGKDNVWVMDRCGDKGCLGASESPIFHLSPDGKTIKNFGAGEFVSAHALAVDKDGNVWAADFQAKDGKGMQVVKFSPDGKVLLKLGKPGESGMGNDTLNQPTGLAVLSTGEILVAEGHGSKLNKSRVNVYSKDGKYLRSFASHGTGDGQLTEPHAIAVDGQDRIYVADRTGNRVAVFDKTGKFLANWKQFGRPSGVWVDKNGMIYVADSQSDEKTNPGCKMGIRVGSVKDGQVLYYIPPPPGVDAKTPPPEGIAVDSHGTIYASAVQMKDVKKYTK